MATGADSGFDNGFNAGFGSFLTFTTRAQLPLDVYLPVTMEPQERQALTSIFAQIFKTLNWNARGVMSIKSSQAALADVVLVDASASEVTVTLLSASMAGAYVMSVKKIDGGNSVKISAQTGQSIDGTQVQSLSAVNQVMTLACDGKTWHKISTM